MRYSSHLPVLMEAINRSTGDVLELGPGVFSTPVLHWMCQAKKRNLLTIENDKKWYRFCKQYYETPLHKFLYVANWDECKDVINKKWDVVLVDHSPSERRIVEISQLANLANYLVIHDSDLRNEFRYHYSEIYPLFKYRFNFDQADYSTVLLSNFVDLKNFTI